jgi:hypothetical protein
MRDRVAAVALAAVMLGGAGAAQAKTERTVTYTFEQVWSTAIRHLRVEEGFAIVEKDPEIGYVMFEVREEKKVFSGALELVRQKETGGRAAVRLVLRISNRPAYMEAGVLDRMVEKLRQEHGEPVPPPEQPAPPKRKPKEPKEPADLR